ICEILSSASQPALNLVEDKQCARLLRQLARQLQKLAVDWADPAFALNCFYADRADAAVELPLQIVEIIECDKIHSRHQRRERMPILFLTSGRKSAKGPTVKRIVQSQQAPLSFVTVVVICARKGPSKLQRPFPSFGPAIAEKCAI